MTGKGPERRLWHLRQRFAGVPKATATSMLRGGLGAGLAIAGLALLGDATGAALIAAPLGASACLVFGAPDSPFAQPRNTAIGHLVGALCGFGALALMDGQPQALCLGVAVGLAVALMIGLRCVHPPAAANPVFIVLTNAPLAFLVTPLMAGVVLLLLFGLIWNRLAGARYPARWW
jgi:CBS-domain-containing membrane protein